MICDRPAKHLQQCIAGVNDIKRLRREHASFHKIEARLNVHVPVWPGVCYAYPQQGALLFDIVPYMVDASIVPPKLCSLS